MADDERLHRDNECNVLGNNVQGVSVRRGKMLVDIVQDIVDRETQDAAEQGQNVEQRFVQVKELVDNLMMMPHVDPQWEQYKHGRYVVQMQALTPFH